MYKYRFRNVAAVCAAVSICLNTVTAAQPRSADAPPPATNEQAPAPAPADTPAHDMQHMDMPMDHGQMMSMTGPREASGTSWLPAATPMYAVHGEAGGWALMAHGSAFLQYLHESGRRGSEQAGSINWLMGMADRTIGAGHIGLRGMFSLEPWTIRGCGYPDLLASGEQCNGEAIHDRQHPHDLVMELAATYDHPLARGVRLQLYGGPAGEPALGPPAFPHRVSAIANPLAPIAHHWLDATHISFGVVTVGLFGPRWKAEGSVFNGREPDETRTNLDFGALDSVSGRVWWLPADRWALQVSAGRLIEAEAGDHGAPRIDVTRLTASATYHRQTTSDAQWATTLAWGRNVEDGADATDAVLAESTLITAGRDVWFGRAEWAGKPGHDLDIVSHDLFDVGKVQAGYTRQVASTSHLTVGVGGSVSAGLVSARLSSLYGRRVNPGVALFLSVRPRATP